MSGKKKDAKLRNRDKVTGPVVKVTRVLEFRRGPKGFLRPKYRWERSNEV
jgi:hypothetical protein